jgi:hypothetical protein
MKESRQFDRVEPERPHIGVKFIAFIKTTLEHPDPSSSASGHTPLKYDAVRSISGRPRIDV